MRHHPLHLAAAIVLLLASPASTLAGSFESSAETASPTQIAVRWTFTEDPAAIVAHPEWVGYDVCRRPVADCGAWVRLNDAPFPRVVGQTHGGSLLDTPPATSTMYTYRVFPVDAQHAPVALLYPDCDPPCSPPVFASCPDLSAPTIVGTVSDWGWAVFLTPCANGCWSSCYVNGPLAGPLRPYIGTGQVVCVFGRMACGTTEGCSLTPDHFELGECGATPVQRGSWGRLKSHYR